MKRALTKSTSPGFRLRSHCEKVLSSFAGSGESWTVDGCYPPTGRSYSSQERNYGLRKATQTQNIPNVILREQRRYKGSRSLSSIKNEKCFRTIHQAQDAMQDLLDRLIEINAISPRPPITVESLATGCTPDTRNEAENSRAIIHQEAINFFRVLMRSVEDGHLLPSRKHGRELSQLAECVLYVCGQHHSYRNDAHTDFVYTVLKVLKVDWNLDVSHKHYDRAIASACAMGNWKLAAECFEEQIDPNAGGTPVVISIKNPLGLYAIARRCLELEEEKCASERHSEESALLTVDDDDDSQKRPSMVAQHVMDAVHKMTMVSPSDQNFYILAAGNALGHVGAWMELDEYRRSASINPEQGRLLTAACLWACCLGKDYPKGIQILQEEILPQSLATKIETSNVKGAALMEQEWQWGGARDLMDPLCRDLAMQLIGGASLVGKSYNEDTNFGQENYGSNLALQLLRQSRAESVTISKEALLGVMEACERDNDWKGAFSVLMTVLDGVDMKDGNESCIIPWIVCASELTIVEHEELQDRRLGNVELQDLGSLLACVMRTCNRSSNFGMALFALQVFHAHLSGSLSKLGSDEEIIENRLLPEFGAEELLRQMAIPTSAVSPSSSNATESRREILSASMVSLSGLRCHKQAIHLFEAFAEEPHDSNAPISLIYESALLQQRKSESPTLRNTWTNAQSHIEKLLKATQLVQRTESKSEKGDAETILSDHQRLGMEELLARAMNSCTAAHQPELSLYLMKWMEERIFVGGILSSQNGIEDADEFLLGRYGDDVISEIILARRWTKNLSGAISLFERTMERYTDDDLIRWKKTVSAGVTTMVANGSGEDAVRIFEALDGDVRSTDTYTSIGRYLSKAKEWQHLIELYKDASAKGYSSEDLSILAMLAVTSTQVENRLRVLRMIVDECAATAGLDPKRWAMKNYWSLKKILGFYHARLLMWWNDEERAPLDEINFAIKEFYRGNAHGSRPQTEVIHAIVSGASEWESFGLETIDGYEKVPRTEDSWASLIGDVLKAADASTIRYDPIFVDSVVQAYMHLGKTRECIDYVSSVIEIDGTRVRQTTLSDALDAAQMENADGLYDDIQMLLSHGD